MNTPNRSATRRGFLKSATATATTWAMARGAYAGGSDVLRVGLIGCGGRGTGAASQALQADPNVKLFAMADAFADRISESLERLRKNEKLAGKIDVSPERQFEGFDAYKNVISCCDVVLLCTPPGFRPLHLRAAVAAGRHVFCEKPVAVDAPGVRSVLETCALAQKKKLSVVSGLCLRYDNRFRATVARLRDGAIGEPLVLQANDLRGPIWVKPRKPEWSDMTWQMRNWYYFTWLSGDFNVEQHVHFLDVCAWVMGDAYPSKAVGSGGRQARTSPEFGHIYDHFAIAYEYANGARLFSHCRQQAGCQGDMSVHVIGTKGRVEFSERARGPAIHTPGKEWHFEGAENDMFQTEHDELFASIRSAAPINNGDYMAKSTLLAIMGRIAAYTGKMVTWDQVLNSKEDLTPSAYRWDLPLPVPPVAVPGRTRFV
jgi:predicted dehydrogenase